MESRIIRAVFGTSKSIKTAPRYQYDYGQELEFTGIALPHVFTVYFSNSEQGESHGSVGMDGRVTIPDEYFQSGEPIYAYVIVHDEATDGRAMYQVTIPIKNRPSHDEEPSPDQKDIIEQAIIRLNEAVEQTAEDARSASESAEQAAEDAESARQSAESARQSAESARDSVGSISGYTDRAERARDRAITAEERATQEATSATQSARDANRDADRAEQAAANAGYLDVEIDEYGHLIYTRTDTVDVDFELVDGHLIMEVI